jgi:hypothetical protein
MEEAMKDRAWHIQLAIIVAAMAVAAGAASNMLAGHPHALALVAAGAALDAGVLALLRLWRVRPWREPPGKDDAETASILAEELPAMLRARGYRANTVTATGLLSVSCRLVVRHGVTREKWLEGCQHLYDGDAERVP